MTRRVLIVDDSDLIRDVLEHALKMKDCEARAVSSREEALTLLSEGWAPELILLDYAMPGLPIELFMQKLIEDRSAALPRVVLMTAGYEADKKAKELGIPEVLRKPFDALEVLNLIAPCIA